MVKYSCVTAKKLQEILVSRFTKKRTVSVLLNSGNMAYMQKKEKYKQKYAATRPTTTTLLLRLIA